jgi:RNA polymerase sigma-70 factor (ECF subfamily)
MARDQPSDDELIAAANKGDESAFERLYHRYKGLVYRVAYLFTRQREDASDAVQEVMPSAPTCMA